MNWADELATFRTRLSEFMHGVAFDRDEHDLRRPTRRPPCSSGVGVKERGFRQVSSVLDRMIDRVIEREKAFALIVFDRIVLGMTPTGHLLRSMATSIGSSLHERREKRGSGETLQGSPDGAALKGGRCGITF